MPFRIATVLSSNPSLVYTENKLLNQNCWCWYHFSEEKIPHLLIPFIASTYYGKYAIQLFFGRPPFINAIIIIICLDHTSASAYVSQLSVSVSRRRDWVLVLGGLHRWGISGWHVRITRRSRAGLPLAGGRNQIKTCGNTVLSHTRVLPTTQPYGVCVDGISVRYIDLQFISSTHTR